MHCLTAFNLSSSIDRVGGVLDNVFFVTVLLKYTGLPYNKARLFGFRPSTLAVSFEASLAVCALIFPSVRVSNRFGCLDKSVD